MKAKAIQILLNAINLEDAQELKQWISVANDIVF